tara:strand:- start:1887 stop:2696 length:810 start_codon:yes stop_codon:yes gene_type:complete
MKKKLFVSNLAWENKNFDIVKELIKSNRFAGIDLAPLKVIGDWKNLKKKSIKSSSDLKKNKIKVNAIQGIYFKKKFNLFSANDKNNSEIYKHTLKIIDICQIYRSRKVIIGSSEFRKKGEINFDIADKVFINFFKRFKKILKKKKIFLCLEAIPRQYDEDFIYDFYHLLKLIKKINSKWIRINFDSSLFHFKEFDKTLLSKNLKYINNIQVTEKNFKYFLRPNKRNIKFCNFLKKSNLIKSVSLEIISKKTDIKKLDRSMKNFKKLLQN